MLKIILQIGLPLVLTISGLLQTFIYLRLRKKLEQWPKVAAEITLSRLLNHLDISDKSVLEAMIYFKYTFRGKEYEVNTPALRGYELFPSYDYENSLVKKYRPGDIVNAMVNPQDPQICYLEIAPLSKISTILAPVFSILGAALLVGYFYGLWDLLYENFFWRVELFFRGH